MVSDFAGTNMDSQRPTSSRTRAFSNVPSLAILHLNMDADDIIHPGPIDNSVLNKQRTHCTEAVWNPQVSEVKADPAMLTVRVERWRLETHTFHFNDGEATITLQDVSLFTGLTVEGVPVTDKSKFNFKEVCERLLGVYPDCQDDSPAMAKRSWFKNHLAEIPADADEETLKKYTRAYLICLLGLPVFIDKSGKTIPLYFLPLLEDLDMEMDWVQKL
ncbi:hypothetical protein QQ045_004944 [Rhodiola kirilowii]